MPILNTVTARDAVDGSEIVFAEIEGDNPPAAANEKVVVVTLGGPNVELSAAELISLAEQLRDLWDKIARPRRDGARISDGRVL